MSTRPPYLSRASEQAFAPPYRQDGCAMYSFAVPAERARLQQIVDRYLTGPSGGRVRPRVVADHVLLYFCDFAQSQSHDPVDAGRGWLGERECGLWIPLHIAGLTTPAFFTHAMFVDSGPAMASGREVLGFPKEIGAVQVPRSPALAASLAVDALVLGGERTRCGRWRPLIELERVPLAATDPTWPTLLRPLAAMLGPGTPTAEVPATARWLARLAALARGRVEFFNLKQFRDCADPTRACYQAVVRAGAALRGARRLALTDAYAYRIHPHDSHPLARELGLPPEGRLRGVFCDIDLDFSTGATL